MLTPDQINGCFEIVGGIFCSINVWRIWKDKQVKGVSLWPVIFFTTWGLNNTWFYPHYDLWYSFAGGLLLPLSNFAWLVLALYYKYYKKPNKEEDEPSLFV